MILIVHIWMGDCPCFLVDSISKIYNNVVDMYCRVSSIDDVIVNDRRLKIGFLECDDLNIIFEVISP